MLKTLELMDSIIDLQLEKISPDEWLKRLAHLAGSKSASSITWVPDEPAKYNFRSSDNNNNAFPVECIKLAEDVISRAPLNGSPFLDDAARSLEDCDGAEYAPLCNKNVMIACLDKEPNRTLLVLAGSKNPEGWAAADRERFAAMLPILRKAHDLHRKLTTAGNKLHVANRILNAIPRGVIALTPDGKVFKANSMAMDILGRQDGIDISDGYLRIAYPQLATEFKQQLHKIGLLPLDIVEKFVWNRGYIDKKSNQFYQLTLGSYPVDNWHLESHPHDRIPVLTISMPNLALRPTAIELGEFYGLSFAQGRVIACMLRGKNINDTATELHISVNTIRSHLRSVYEKLGVNNKSELFRLLSVTLVNYESPRQK
jgi:DNA-binding CsgD family transcriptional regulator